VLFFIQRRVSVLWCKSGFADVGVPWCTHHGTPTTNKQTPRYTKNPHLQHFFLFFFMPGGFVGVVGTGGFVGVDTQWHTNNKQTTITAHQMSALTIVCVLLFLVSLPCVTVGSWVMMCRGVYTTTHQQQTNKHHGTPHIRTDKRVVLLSWFLRHGVEVGSWV